ncbi:Oidioi.mRNA.OKI2018_I69.PAR.g12499.t1.cds [Oikopleura dioica]|uniref:Oidioi.mRNA.OKI2018_I69.PAR.g12499.t1.cds n=1 Tax=Oikopleura dioica TaxID=34765 RepID=A0ABN7S3Q4_OIKDI|nr:Oidioi.mRNA.OKI2018_I69.PAR.g12499.t1.cds [Oikopleura dioica]
MAPGLVVLKDGNVVVWSGSKVVKIDVQQKAITISKDFEGLVNDVIEDKETFLVSHDKTVSIVDPLKMELIQRFDVPRRPSKLCVVDQKCYIADKSGDVYLVDMSDEEIKERTDVKTMKPILGHISLIMDTFVSDKFIYTAEQDEKIKVSSRKHPFIIDHYLLGHTEYVSKIQVDEESNALFSAGGDGTIRSWKNGKADNVKEHEEETVCHSLVASQDHLQYATVSFEDNKDSCIRTVAKRDLAEYHTWKLEGGSVPISSAANSTGLGAYWLIEKEKSLQLYFAKDKELELVLQDVVESSWKEDHWKVLKKQLEKSDNYEKYLQMREEGFKKARGGRKKQKRKIMEPNSDSNDAKKVNVETVTAT